MDREALARSLMGLGLTRARAKSAVDALFRGIAGALREGRAVSIVGFGRWEWRGVGARTLRDPRTGAERRVPERRKLVFKPSGRLKREVNRTGP